uniref:Peptidase S1 domain-containing protein n=1 Tax=Heterorhabditis bacteriophora TaxID=37862 RepID=A0A1I7W6L0_HETBA
MVFYICCNDLSLNSYLSQMHDFDWIKTFLFFILEETGFKSCVRSLTPHYMVTFRHGTHLNYVKDSTVVRVLLISSGKQYDAVVTYICEEQDYVILKSNEEVVERECPIQQCDVMKRFVVCGFTKGLSELNFIRGTVYSVYPFVYENNGKQYGAFVYGTARTSLGDSGAACFGTYGLMAINLGTTTMPLKHHNEAISEAAVYSSNNYMIPASRLIETLWNQGNLLSDHIMKSVMWSI